jgi:hypothetical protein
MVDEAVTDDKHPGKSTERPVDPSEIHEEISRALPDSLTPDDESFLVNTRGGDIAADFELASSTLRAAEDSARVILTEAERQAAEMTAASETLMKEAHLFRAEARQALDDARNQVRVMRGRAEAAETQARKTLEEAHETNAQARSMYENAAELKKRAQSDVGKRLSAVEREADSIRTTALADAERMRAAAAAEAREIANETRADVDITTENANTEAQRVLEAAHREAETIIERAHQLALAVRRDALRGTTESREHDDFEGHGDGQATRQDASTSAIRGMTEGSDPTPIDLTDGAARPESDPEGESEAEPEAVGTGRARKGLLRRRRR